MVGVASVIAVGADVSVGIAVEVLETGTHPKEKIIKQNNPSMVLIFILTFL